MGAFEVDRFQSLLCWIMVCKTPVIPDPDPESTVSILVMLDYGL